MLILRNYLFGMNEYKLINYFLFPLIINNYYLSQTLSFINDYYHKYHSEYIFI